MALVMSWHKIITKHLPQSYKNVVHGYTRNVQQMIFTNVPIPIISLILINSYFSEAFPSIIRKLKNSTNESTKSEIMSDLERLLDDENNWDDKINETLS